MATRQLKDFLPLVLPHAPSCPRVVAEQYLRLSAIEWCERTRAWRHITTVTVDEQNEAIVAPDYATIHEIERAEFTPTGGDTPFELCPTQFTALDRLADLSEAAGSAVPEYITQVSPNTIALIPLAEGTVELSLFLKPRNDDEFSQTPGDPLANTYNVVPEHLLIQSGEPIAEGALGRLLALRGTEWFDPKMAAYYRARFDKALDRSFQTQLRGQHRARPRSKASFI